MMTPQLLAIWKNFIVTIYEASNFFMRRFDFDNNKPDNRHRGNYQSAIKASSPSIHSNLAHDARSDLIFGPKILALKGFHQTILSGTREWIQTFYLLLLRYLAKIFQYVNLEFSTLTMLLSTRAKCQREFQWSFVFCRLWICRGRCSLQDSLFYRNPMVSLQPTAVPISKRWGGI